MTVNRFGRRAVWLAACATAAIATPSFAQQSTPAADSGDDEVVIVTATRRDSALQETAVAVTALGASALQDAGVRDIRDLTQLAPSLQVPVSESSASVTARIRGIGTQGSNPGLESSVGVFVDGVYRARNGVAFGDLGELRSIEVLRGPQGTLFGRNTSAGLINVSTQAPAFEFGTTGELTFGDYGAAGAGVGITGPMFGTETIAGRLYVGGRTREGWMTVNPNGPEPGEAQNQNYFTIRGQMLFEPMEGLTARLIGDYAERSEACCASAPFLDGPTNGLANYILADAIGPASAFENDQAWANGSYNQKVKDQGFSFEVNYELGDVTLTSVSAWRNWAWQYDQDGDFSRLDLTNRSQLNLNGNEFTTITQEVRLAGTAGRLDWVVGGFYSDETIDRNDNFRIGANYEQWFGGLLAGAAATSLPVGYVAPTTATGGPTSLPDVVRRAITLASLLPRVGVPTLAQRQAPALIAGSGTNDVYQQTAESIALFTHNIFEVTDQLSLTLGLRYTMEDKAFRADYNTLNNAGCRAIESAYGLNPAGFAAGLAASDPANAAQWSTAATINGNICTPWQRSALDNLDHRQSREEREWSGIASIAYQLTDDINTYFSFSRGYKAGGFNLDRAFSDAAGSIVSGTPVIGNTAAQTVRGPDTSFAPEIVDAFELGVKTEWFDRALTLNMALYHQTFENFQLNTFNGISFIVTAVPEVVAQGIEVDYRLRTPIEGLTLSGGFAYADSKYADNLGDPRDPNSFLGRNLNLYYLPGSQLTSAPEWTFGSALSYERSLSGGFMLRGYGDFRTVTEYNTGSNLDPRKIQDGYTLFNGRLAIASPDDTWSLELWGRNLTDERYAQVTFDGPLQGSSPTLVRTGTGPTATITTGTITSRLGAFMGEPRMIGVTFRWNR